MRAVTEDSYNMFSSVSHTFSEQCYECVAYHVGRGTMANKRIGKLPMSAAGMYTFSKVSQASALSCTGPMSHAVVMPAAYRQSNVTERQEP